MEDAKHILGDARGLRDASASRRIVKRESADFCNHWQQSSANNANILSTSQGLKCTVRPGNITKGISVSIATRESGKKHADEQLINTLKDGEIRASTKTLDTSKRHLGRQKCDVSQTHPAVKVAMPGFSSKPSCRALKVISDHKRRERISAGVKALEELLSNPVKDGKEAVLDDVIDHVKFLKVQLQALGHSRLGGEAASDPVLYIEGYGHYLSHKQIAGDPLEELLGELMETDMGAAIEFLHSKGLAIAPWPWLLM